MKRLGPALLAFTLILWSGPLLPAAPADDRPPASNRLKPDHAPTPFSADEIRRGCPDGRTTRYKIEANNRPTVYQQSTFFNSTAEGTSFRAWQENEQGQPMGDPMESSATWKELQAHASFPETSTSISVESYTTPAGTFDCWLYVVTTEKDNQRHVDRFWFARSLPGPPLCYEKAVNGKMAYRMTMIRAR
jgi:hypothetical protein